MDLPPQSGPLNSLKAATEAREPHGSKRLPSFAAYDRILRAVRARATQGISPIAIADAWSNWAVHLAMAPGKQAELALSAASMAARFRLWLLGAFAGEPHEPPPPYDLRFADADWKQFPFNAIAETHLMIESWWQDAVR
jgi:polyhydroxyalkanoate synthase